MIRLIHDIGSSVSHRNTIRNMQGRSFQSVLSSGQAPADWPQATYYRYWMHMAHRHANPAHFGIRTGDYKLIFFYGRFYKDTSIQANLQGWGNRYAFDTPPAWEFYDLKKDPHEMDNRYARPEYADIITELKAQLKTLRRDLNEEDENYPHIK